MNQRLLTDIALRAEPENFERLREAMREREEDKRYWRPLREELEALRHGR